MQFPVTSTFMFSTSIHVFDFECHVFDFDFYIFDFQIRNIRLRLQKHSTSSEILFFVFLSGTERRKNCYTTSVLELDDVDLYISRSGGWHEPS